MNDFPATVGVHHMDGDHLDRAHAHPEIFAAAPHVFGIPIVVNLPAFAIVAALTAILVIGMRESAWLNTGIVIFEGGARARVHRRGLLFT